ncbi:MAG: hypothetical protein LUO89_14645 [Methanothrix sp.]|nr:hypothetical protein [Methanothrix sp.]
MLGDMLQPASSLSSREAVQNMRAITSLSQRGPFAARPPLQKARKWLHAVWHKQRTCWPGEGKPPSGRDARRAEKQCLALFCGHMPRDCRQTMKISDKYHCSYVFLSWRHEDKIDERNLTDSQERAGKIRMVPNLDCDPKEIFMQYKSRDRTENIFGHIFVSFLSLYVYSKIEQKLKRADILDSKNDIDFSCTKKESLTCSI